MMQIIVLARPSLFSDGLIRLLEQCGITVLFREQDFIKVVGRLGGMIPDAIVVAEEESELLLAQVITGGLTTKILAVRENSNTVNIYRRESRQVSRIEDFAEAIMACQEQDGSGRTGQAGHEPAGHDPQTNSLE
jgi:hypothetical protein